MFAYKFPQSEKQSAFYFSTFDQKIEKTKPSHTQRENWLLKSSNLPVFVPDMGILLMPIHKVYNTKWCVIITAFTWGKTLLFALRA